MPRLTVAAALLLLSFALALPSELHAQSGKKGNALISAATAQDVVDALDQAGAYDLEVSTDSYGDPQIDGRVDELNFSVRFYRCDGGAPAACTQVQFRISFGMNYERDYSMYLANDWDRSFVFGKASVDDADSLILEHMMYLAGGVRRENLEVNAELWIEIMPDFAEHVGWE